MNKAFLLLGSNLGDRLRNLLLARKTIEKTTGKVVSASGFYETEPWGNKEQPCFINQALILDTSLAPTTLLKTLLDIELEYGRKREQKWGARTLDIDILFFDDLIISQEELKLPHQELHNRNFVLAPMAEIAPDFIHPVFNVSIKTLFERCEDTLEVKRLYQEAITLSSSLSSFS